MADLQANLIVMAVCYLYIILIIVLSRYLKKGILGPKSSRKFLHSMIGNLPLIMPFFTNSIFPFLVAIPFVLVTYLVTPFSPFPGITKKLDVLSDITEDGHHIGLVLYAISYSILAYFYGLKPYIVAAGIFPMAYGDSTAAMLGMRFGRKKLGSKSIEGCLGMFLGSLISLLLGMAYFSYIYGFIFSDLILSVILVSLIVTIAELISPGGLDNIAVPILGAMTFIFLRGSG